MRRKLETEGRGTKMGKERDRTLGEMEGSFRDRQKASKSSGTRTPRAGGEL